jgi:hypothetical protein
MLGIRYDFARLTPLGWWLFSIHAGLLVAVTLAVFLGDSKTLSLVLLFSFALFGVGVWILDEHGYALHKRDSSNDRR